MAKYLITFIGLEKVVADPTSQVPVAQQKGGNVGKTYAKVITRPADKLLPDERDFVTEIKFLADSQIAYYQKMIAEAVSAGEKKGMKDAAGVVIPDFEEQKWVVQKKVEIVKLDKFYMKNSRTGEFVTRPDGSRKVYEEIRVVVPLDSDGNPEVSAKQEAIRLVDTFGEWMPTGDVAGAGVPFTPVDDNIANVQ